MSESRDVAIQYLLRAVQSWGQTPQNRDDAERKYVEFAGYRHGSDEAKAFVLDTVRNLKRGEFNNEVDQLEAALLQSREATHG